jgi:uncharacterized protein (TIGR02246 family)
VLSQEDRDAIRCLRERLRASIVYGDAEGYALCFAEGAVLMHPESPQVRGRQAIAKYVAAMFDAIQVPVLELAEVVLDGGGGFAFEVGTQECEIEPSMPGFKRKRQHLHAYRQSGDGSWYIAAAMSGNQ